MKQFILLFSILLFNVALHGQNNFEVLPAFNKNIIAEVKSSIRYNRYSQNENGYYAEVLKENQCYVFNADKVGNIISKELFLTIPQQVYEMLLDKHQDYKIEDVRKSLNGSVAIEIISKQKKYAIEWQGEILINMQLLK